MIEIVVVLLIMGFLAMMVLPIYRGTIVHAEASLNKSHMQMIKKAVLEFYNDLGFVPDNISFLTYPWEQCTVKAVNFDDENSSDICKNMIAFIDRHYKLTVDNPALRVNSSEAGDLGVGTVRTLQLIAIIQDKLDPKNGWRGAYISGNAQLKKENIKRLGGTEEGDNLYFFSDTDLKLYYKNFSQDTDLSIVDTSFDADKANAKLYPIYAERFGNGMDQLYENARMRKEDSDGNVESTLIGHLSILDPWGTPYEIQIPKVSGSVRTRLARIVSFGPDRRRDTPIDSMDIDYLDPSYDDSVLYIFDTNHSSFYYGEQF